MPVYGVAQAGGQLTSVIPGNGFTMFNGTETAVQGLRSVAFSRGYSPSGDDAGSTFYASGMPSGSVIQIQGSNTDLEADYLVIGTLTPDTNGNAAYTDIGRAAFYTGVLSTYTTGTMPILKVQR